MKTPFVASDMENLMNRENYNPENIVVSEKDGVVTGFYAINMSVDPKNEKIFFGGVTTDPDHQDIEALLMKEVENRALTRGKKIFELRFYPDSLRLPLAKELGFIQTGKYYRLEKALI